MSKAIDTAFTKLKGIKNAASKFSASAAEGNRIVPSRTKDAEYQVRVDAGHFDPTTKSLNGSRLASEFPSQKSWVGGLG